MSEFWESKAEEHGFDVDAVNNDPLEEKLELFYLHQIIPNEDVRFLDFGCGNGRTTLELAEKHPDITFYAVDLSEEMIETAKEMKTKLELDNVHFYRADARDTTVQTLLDSKFDWVMSKRLLINTHGDEKYDVIDNIHSLLKSDGTYLMIECFLEPLQRVNEIRHALGLHRIEVHDFNEYLHQQFLNDIAGEFTVERRIDFESFYYYVSRVFNAYLADGNPSYHADVNQLSVELTKLGYDETAGYGPEIIYRMRKND
jgi:ubiquinone/menaquinone biosynthesis C-methylase UbiE